MGRNILFVIIFLSTVLFAGCFRYSPNFAVPLSYKEKYLPYLGEGEKMTIYGYNYIQSKLRNYDKICRQFYPEKDQLILEYKLTSSYSSFSYVMNGSYKSWWDHGLLKSSGNMYNDKKHGTWQFYDFYTGKVSSRDSFYNGAIISRETYYDNGNLSFSCNYKDKLLDGEFAQYDYDGSIINEGIYRADTIFSETNPTTDTIKTIGPRFKGCENLFESEKEECANEKLSRYISNNLQYPKLAKLYEVEGTVIVQFVVGINGSITDVTFIQGICYPMEKAVRELIEQMPNWIPGEQDGIKIPVIYTLPVGFWLPK